MALRHCEPTGRPKAPPDDRLREAVRLSSSMKNGLLLCGACHRARFSRDPLAPRENDNSNIPSVAFGRAFEGVAR